MDNPADRHAAIYDALMRRERQKGLSTRDRKLFDAFAGAQSDPVEEELSLNNVTDLVKQIARTSDPKAKALLMEELERIKGMMNMLGPQTQQQGFLPDMRRLGTVPAVQLPPANDGMPPMPPAIMERGGVNGAFPQIDRRIPREPFPMPLIGGVRG